MIVLNQRETTIRGRHVLIDNGIGHLMVAHDGRITWDELQAIKDEVWGPEARAIEVYPRRSDVVNSGHFRHLWRLGEGDFCPDLLKHEEADYSSPSREDALEARHRAAWDEAEKVFA